MERQKKWMVPLLYKCLAFREILTRQDIFFFVCIRIAVIWALDDKRGVENISINTTA
jgi:hypothetical protein